MKESHAIQLQHFIPGLVWWGFTLWLFTMPGSSVPTYPWLARIHADKLVHLSLFIGWCILFSWPFRNSNVSNTGRQQWFLWIALAGVLYGIAVEYIQREMNVGRAFEINDVIADGFGCTIGYWLSKKFFGQKKIGPDRNRDLNQN
ncbi:MAG: VanZ family protein [Bacteroidota bacterium]